MVNYNNGAMGREGEATVGQSATGKQDMKKGGRHRSNRGLPASVTRRTRYFRRASPQAFETHLR